MSGGKIIVCGGRNFRPSAVDAFWLGYWLKHFGAKSVVSGGAPGADAMGERFAEVMGLPVKRFPPDWAKHGKAAGPIRNRQMADYADAVIAFPGGKGTESMLQIAKEAGLEIAQVCQ